jgi:hypothetical protein
MTSSGSSDRSFGVVFAIVFALIGFWPLTAEASVHIWALFVSAGFLLVALIRPVLLATLNKLWTKFGFLLNKITSPVVLGVVFFLVITPFALVTRLFGRDVLRLAKDSGAKSYWIAREPAGPDPTSIKNQF